MVSIILSREIKKSVKNIQICPFLFSSKTNYLCKFVPDKLIFLLDVSCIFQF